MQSTNHATDLFEQHRRRLFALAYRMTGSRVDAEDLVQEAWLRWHGTTPDLPAQPWSWLARVMVRLCLDHLKSAAVKREQYTGVWLPEPLLDPLEAPAERYEALDYAMLVLLEQLSPLERAVVILRESFDSSFREIADYLDLQEDHARQVNHRAKRRLQGHEKPSAANTERHRTLMTHFIDACREGDMARLLALFHQDITLCADGGGKVVSALRPVLGPDRVAKFLLGIFRKMQAPTHMRLVYVNGQAGALICAAGNSPTLLLPAWSSDGVRHCYIQRNPDKLKAFLADVDSLPNRVI